MDISLTEIACCDCGVIFWVTRSHNAELLDKKTTFYCPNGHMQSYRKNEADRLRAEIEMKDRQIANLRQDLEKKCRKPRAKKKS